MLESPGVLLPGGSARAQVVSVDWVALHRRVVWTYTLRGRQVV